MRHQRSETTIRRGDRGQALRTAVGVERVLLGRLAVAIDITHRAQHFVGIAALREVREALAVCDRDRQAAAGHAGEEDARRIDDLDLRQAGLELLAAVADELGPVLGARDHRRQRRQHLAAVADAQREAVRTGEEGLERGLQHRVEEDGARPALAGAQRVAVAETTAGDEALEVLQVDRAGLQVAHVHVIGVEAGLRHGVGHLDMRVDALLAQDRDLGAHAAGDEGGGDVLLDVEGRQPVQALAGRAGQRMLLVRAGRVVAIAGDAPGHLVPLLLQLVERRGEDLLGVAPDLGLLRVVGLADDVRDLRQAVRAQRLQDGVAVGGGDLQQHAQFLVEQGLERQFLAARADLRGPVLGVAHLGAAVADAVALGDQHVDIEADAALAGKAHFQRRGEEAAVAAVVVGQQAALTAQVVDRGHQRLEQRRIVEVGHLGAELVQGLRQDRAAHAHAALAEVDQHQRGVAVPQLRRERAPHVG